MATTQQSGSVAASAPAPDPEVPERARTRTFSPRYKLDILNQYESLNKQGKGALLRREGLYSSPGSLSIETSTVPLNGLGVACGLSIAEC